MSDAYQQLNKKIKEIVATSFLNGVYNIKIYSSEEKLYYSKGVNNKKITFYNKEFLEKPFIYRNDRFIIRKFKKNQNLQIVNETLKDIITDYSALINDYSNIVTTYLNNWIILERLVNFVGVHDNTKDNLFEVVNLLSLVFPKLLATKIRESYNHKNNNEKEELNHYHFWIQNSILKFESFEKARDFYFKFFQKNNSAEILKKFYSSKLNRLYKYRNLIVHNTKDISESINGSTITEINEIIVRIIESILYIQKCISNYSTSFADSGNNINTYINFISLMKKDLDYPFDILPNYNNEEDDDEFD